MMLKLLLGVCYLIYALIKLSELLPPCTLQQLCKRTDVHKAIEIAFVLVLAGLATLHLWPILLVFEYYPTPAAEWTILV